MAASDYSEPVEGESLGIRLAGRPDKPVLIYLPGAHGDWTLVGSFREAIAPDSRWVEITYPRTLTWSLEDYANGVIKALLDHGITSGWLLGESFGSQVAWAMVRAASGTEAPGNRFRIEGLVLAGGFVKHPMIWGVRFGRWLWDAMPLSALHGFLAFYLCFARWQHRHEPETLASLAEFAARRNPLDRRALSHRLRLIAANDPRALAQSARFPVYYLSGWLDLIVPWPWVRQWLRANCPSVRETVVLNQGDHAVLVTAPLASARLVRQWITPPIG